MPNPELRLPEIGLHSRPRTLSREQWTRWIALLIFCDPVPEGCFEGLSALTISEWKRLLCWLHVSGLALYFFHRLRESQRHELLPTSVAAQLQKDLEDNTERTNGMLVESIEIQRDLQDACVQYAVLKGLSLWPSSVPSPELRLQFDLDFLVSEDEMRKAREILERRGYRLYGANGRSWEFKRNEMAGLNLKDVYKNTGSWMVELHADPHHLLSYSPFERLQWRKFHGFSMPVLSPVDLFLLHGLHAYKHACSEFARAGFLMEFRRNVLHHARDRAFWNELYARAGNDHGARFGLGFVTLLVSSLMGNFAPEELTRWTVDRLPQSARLWIEMYGLRVVLGGFPGSKLYLLLRSRPAEEDTSRGKSIRQVLVPLCTPQPVIRARPHENVSARLVRYWMYLELFVNRLRFHIVAGLRFWWESYRWRRANEGLQCRSN